MTNRYRSPIMAAIHETAQDLNAAGLIDKQTMREFDAACLTPVRALSAEEQARRRYAVEQANAHNRIEGIMPNPAADAIYERWIAGEIDSDEVTRRIRTIPLRHFGPD